MRVIAGEFGRRKLEAPKGDTTRPTPDRMRESLFSILAPELEGVEFTDLYCGSGAVGIEAISRGAAHCTFVEKDRAALAALEKNLKTLGVGTRATVVAKPVGAYVGGRVLKGFVFVDPPYEQATDYEMCMEALGKSEATKVLVQHDRRLKLEPRYGNLERYRELKQGDNWVSFYGLVGA